MKLENITRETLKFECGDEEVHDGYRTVIEGGQIGKVERRKRAPKLWTVAPGEVIELEDGYCVPRGGTAAIPRPSFLVEAGLADKLVPYVPKATAPKAAEKAAR